MTRPAGIWTPRRQRARRYDAHVVAVHGRARPRPARRVGDQAEHAAGSRPERGSASATATSAAPASTGPPNAPDQIEPRPRAGAPARSPARPSARTSSAPRPPRRPRPRAGSRPGCRRCSGSTTAPATRPRTPGGRGAISSVAESVCRPYSATVSPSSASGSAGASNVVAVQQVDDRAGEARERRSPTGSSSARQQLQAEHVAAGERRARSRAPATAASPRRTPTARNCVPSTSRSAAAYRPTSWLLVRNDEHQHVHLAAARPTAGPRRRSACRARSSGQPPARVGRAPRARRRSAAAAARRPRDATERAAEVDRPRPRRARRPRPAPRCPTIAVSARCMISVSRDELRAARSPGRSRASSWPSPRRSTPSPTSSVASRASAS